MNSCRGKASSTSIKRFQELTTVSKSIYLWGLPNCKTKLIFCYVLKYLLTPKGFFFYSHYIQSKRIIFPAHLPPHYFRTAELNSYIVLHPSLASKLWLATQYQHSCKESRSHLAKHFKQKNVGKQNNQSVTQTKKKSDTILNSIQK